MSDLMRWRALSLVSTQAALMLFMAAPLAHENGHGPRDAGKGPDGGQLNAVIAAEQAELGEKALPLAWVEWRRIGQSIELKWWDSTRTKRLRFESPAQAKVIYLPSAGGAPVVAPFMIPAGSEFLLQKHPQALPLTKQIELIFGSLPGGPLASGKRYVFSIHP